MRRVHEADDSMIDRARQLGAQICGLVLVGKAGHSGNRLRGFLASGKSCSRRSRIGNENPDKTILLLACVAAGKDTINFEVLACGKRRNQPTLAAVHIKSPAVITAFQLLALELAAG